MDRDRAQSAAGAFLTTVPLGCPGPWVAFLGCRDFPETAGRADLQYRQIQLGWTSNIGFRHPRDCLLILNMGVSRFCCARLSWSSLGPIARPSTASVLAIQRDQIDPTRHSQCKYGCGSQKTSCPRNYPLVKENDLQLQSP